MTEISQPDKFIRVLGELFDSIEVVIGDLNNMRKTTLNESDVRIVGSYMKSLDKDILIEKFINNSEPFWNNIKKKEDDYIIKNMELLLGEYAKYEKFNALKVIFGAGILDDLTKDRIREYLFALIRISINHVYKSKDPKVQHLTDGKIKISYANAKSFPNIKVADHAKNWGLKLW